MNYMPVHSYPYNVGSASTQAVSCKTALRRYSGTISRNDDAADGGLCTRPLGVHQKVQHVVTVAWYRTTIPARMCLVLNVLVNTDPTL